MRLRIFQNRVVANFYAARRGERWRGFRSPEILDAFSSTTDHARHQRPHPAVIIVPQIQEDVSYEDPFSPDEVRSTSRFHGSRGSGGRWELQQDVAVPHQEMQIWSRISQSRRSCIHFVLSHHSAECSSHSARCCPLQQRNFSGSSYLMASVQMHFLFELYISLRPPIFHSFNAF